MKKPVIAIAGLTACSGCQLTFLNCEQELPDITQRFILDYFPMAETERIISGPIDVAFVEGAVSTPEDLDTLVKLRNHSRLLVAFGTCALWGGIAAMKNHESRKDLAEAVYGPAGDNLKTFHPQPFHRFVRLTLRLPAVHPRKGSCWQHWLRCCVGHCRSFLITRSVPSVAIVKISAC